MSKISLEELRSKSVQALQDQIDLWREEYTKLKIEANLQKKAEKPHMFRFLRKQTARAMTLIKQKQMEGG